MAECVTYDDVKPYRIHVSSRYLKLTKQKLELSRLPHEQPASSDWWEPKSHVEPLIDFWLDEYSWREEEAALNAGLPQYRTQFTIAGFETRPVRIHLVHVPSRHANAVPLLLIPPFPLTSLSFGHLVELFTDPKQDGHVVDQLPFHLVIPSLPGLGFSDSLPDHESSISKTADMFDTLMRRLSYPHYLVTNAGSGTASPAHIDWRLIDHLATHYPDTCLGSHFIAPPLARPRFGHTPAGWAKWWVAHGLHIPVFGYSREDLDYVEREKGRRKATKTGSGIDRQVGVLRDPNTLAYALCDSPPGVLVYILAILRMFGSKWEFSHGEMVTLAQFTWLPGPEAAMRFWICCARSPDEKSRTATAKKHRSRPRIAITVFSPDDGSQEPGGNGGEGYVCPAWAQSAYHVVHTQRVVGHPGLLAWERPEVIVSGVRGLAWNVLKLDPRLRPAAPSPSTLQQEKPLPRIPRTPKPQPITKITPATDMAQSLKVLRLDDRLLTPIPEEKTSPRRESGGATRLAPM